MFSRLGMMLRGADAKPMERQGVGGTNAVGGFLVSPERSADLAYGPTRFKNLNEMSLNSSVVGTGVRYFLSMVAGVGWTVSPPPEGGPEAERLAELIEDIIHDMDIPWYRAVRGAALFKLMGFSVQEWIAKRRDDGVIGIKTIERRPQWTIEQWDLDEAGVVYGFGQRVPYSGELLYIPRDKTIYIVDDSISDQPDGVGLLRHCVETHRQLKRYEQLEGWGFECDARGIPVAKAPLGYLESLVERGLMTREEADKRIKGITAIVRNHVKNPGLGLVRDSAVYTDQSPNLSPSGTEMYGLELLRGDGAGLSEINEAIKRKNFEIARILGIEGLLLGGDGKGSLALATEKTTSFARLLASSLDEIAWSFQKDIIEVLFELNGWDKKLKPTLKPDIIGLANVADITKVLVDLAQAGAPIPPDDDVWNQVREMVGLVEGREVNREVAGILGASPAGPVPPMSRPPAPMSHAEVDDQDVEDEQDDQDDTDVEDEQDETDQPRAGARLAPPGAKPMKPSPLDMRGQPSSKRGSRISKKSRGSRT
jgi:hypothetical protein